MSAQKGQKIMITLVRRKLMRPVLSVKAENPPLPLHSTYCDCNFNA